MQVKKIVNDPRQVVPELLEGLVAASHGRLKKVGGVTAVARAAIPDGKVAVLVGGGSGHEPMFAGYVGENLADGAACGNVFAAPTPDVVLEATRAVNRGNGVLYVYGNYSGDNMNFDIAAEMAAEEGIRVKTVRVWDDVASAPLDRIADRRGIAGDLFVIKAAGAAAAMARDLDEAYRLTAKARDATRSMGVAVSAGSIPETGKKMFDLPDDEIEIGMGIHGEPGVVREKLLRADPLVERMMARILADLPFGTGDEVCVLLNDLGATTAMELLIAARRVHRILSEAGIRIHDTLVGKYCTTQEMAGFSITLMKLDEELRALYEAPARSLAFTRA